MPRPDYVVVKRLMCGVYVCVWREEEKREWKRNTQGRQISKKGRREAQKIKDSAMCLTGGWLGWPAITKSFARLVQSPFRPAWPHAPVMSLLCLPCSSPLHRILFTPTNTVRSTTSLCCRCSELRAVDHVSEPVFVLPDSVSICTNFAKVHRKLA
jgi:hypothetical protein